MPNKSFVRFWRGYPKPGIDLDEFCADLNDIFITETAALSRKGAGLVSYQPVLTERDLLEEGAFSELAAEFALVEYRSESAYQAFRKTDGGRQYSELHWEFFDAEKSRSAVVEPFLINTVPEDFKAYDLLGMQADWHGGHSRFSILPRPAMELDRFYRTLKSRPPEGLKSLVMLVMPTHIVQYSLWEDVADCLGAGSSVFPFPPVMDIETVCERRKIDYGEGINHPEARSVIELFHRIADSESATVRKELVRRGLQDRVKFRNVDSTPGFMEELLAATGRTEVPVVRFEGRIFAGPGEILPLLDKLT